MRSYDEMLDEIEHANGGDGPDPIETFMGPGLAELAAAIEARAAADSAVARAVDHARDQGATWETIGGVLGMTRQGALKRYAHTS